MRDEICPGDLRNARRAGEGTVAICGYMAPLARAGGSRAYVRQLYYDMFWRYR